MWPYTDEEADYLARGSRLIDNYVSDRVFDGIRPVTGMRLEALKRKRAKKLARKRGN